MQSFKEVVQDRKPGKSVPSVSAVLEDGSIVEMIRENNRTAFAIWRNGETTTADRASLDQLVQLVPYSSNNNLLQNEVVLFPSGTADYGSEGALLKEIREFIHRYVDLSPFFEMVASYYVLFSWIYDGFNELPYLRVIGDPGSGKTRFLQIVGSICYKPIFASGASTISPIFRMLSSFKGTLVLDESDFRMSDEKAEIVKILNNGNVRGFPVLRSEVSKSGEYNPYAYHVFGPKLIAARRTFDDHALETRMLTEEMGNKKMRADIPINLPPEHMKEAQTLRNKLLLFRFRNLFKRTIDASRADLSLEPRLNQIFVPLLSLIDEDDDVEEFTEKLRSFNRDLIQERGQTTEAQVLEIIRSLHRSEATVITVAEITERFTQLHGEEYERKITAKWIGYVLRKRLQLHTQKSNGVFVLPVSESPKLCRLYEKFGIEEK